MPLAVGIEDLAGVQVGKHDLGGGDQEVVARDVIGVVLELGQLARAKHGPVSYTHLPDALLGHTRLAGEHLRPLGQLSVTAVL